MAWAQVRKTQYNSTAANTSHSPTFTAPTAGNLLICVVNADAVINSFTAGWTQAAAAVNFTALRIYYKIAAGSETGVTIALSNTRSCQTITFEYSGNAASSPLDLGNGATGSNATPTTPSITTTDPGDLVIVGFGKDDTTTYSAMTGTYTVESDQRTTGAGGNGADDALYSGSRVLSATGSQSASCTQSGLNSSWTAVIAAFKPSASSSFTRSPSSSITHTGTLTRAQVLARAPSSSIAHTGTITRTAQRLRQASISLGHAPALTRAVVMARPRTSSINHTVAIARAQALARLQSVSVAPTVTLTRSAPKLRSGTSSIAHTAISARSEILARLASISIAPLQGLTRIGADAILFRDSFTSAVAAAWGKTDTGTHLSIDDHRVYFDGGIGSPTWADPALVWPPTTGVARVDFGGFAVLLRLTNRGGIGPAVGVQGVNNPASPQASRQGLVFDYPNFKLSNGNVVAPKNLTARSIDLLVAVLVRAGSGYLIAVSVPSGSTGGPYPVFPQAALLWVEAAGTSAALFAHLANYTGHGWADEATVIDVTGLPTPLSTKWGGTTAGDDWNRANATLSGSTVYGGKAYTFTGFTTPAISSNALAMADGDGFHVNAGTPGGPATITEISLTTPSGARGIEILFRGDGGVTNVLGAYFEATEVGVWDYNAGTWLTNTLTSSSVRTGAYSLPTSTFVRLVVVDWGTHFKIYMNDQDLFGLVGSTVLNTGTYVGIHVYNAAHTVDDFAVWPSEITLPDDFGPLPAVPKGLGSAIVSYTFTGTNNTALTTYNAAWTVVSGTWEIFGNKLRQTAADQNGVAVISTGSAGVNHEIRANITMPGATYPYTSGQDWFPALFARWTDANNFIMARFLYQDDSPEIEIWIYVAGVSQSGVGPVNYLNLLPGNLAVSSTHEMRLAVLDDEVSVFWNGELVVQCHTDLLTGSLAGVGVRDNTPKGQPSWDDVEIRATGSSSLSRTLFSTITHTAILTRQVSVMVRSALSSVAHSATITRSAVRTRSAASSIAPANSLARSEILARAASSSIASTVTVARLGAHPRTSTVSIANTAAVTRANTVTRALLSSIAHTATLTGARNATVRNLSSSIAHTAAVLRQFVGTRLGTSSVANTAAVTRTAARTRSATSSVAHTAGLTRTQVLTRLATASTAMTATLSRSVQSAASYQRDLSINVAPSVTATRRVVVARLTTASVAPTATLVRAVVQVRQSIVSVAHSAILVRLGAHPRGLVVSILHTATVTTFAARARSAASSIAHSATASRTSVLVRSITISVANSVVAARRFVGTRLSISTIDNTATVQRGASVVVTRSSSITHTATVSRLAVRVRSATTTIANSASNTRRWVGTKLSVSAINHEADLTGARALTLRSSTSSILHTANVARAQIAVRLASATNQNTANASRTLQAARTATFSALHGSSLTRLGIRARSATSSVLHTAAVTGKGLRSRGGVSSIGHVAQSARRSVLGRALTWARTHLATVLGITRPLTQPGEVTVVERFPNAEVIETFGTASVQERIW